MKSKALNVVLAGIVAATMFVMVTTSAYADYPRAHAGHAHHHHNHGGHLNISPYGVSFGNGRVGVNFGNGYSSNRFQFQPNYWGTRPQYQQNYRPNYRPTYVAPRVPHVPNFGNPLIVPRYNNGAYRQFYIDPSNYPNNYPSNMAQYNYPAPYGTGVERHEFLRFQQETRDQLRQLSEQQRRSNVEQQQLGRGQQQLQLGQQRLEREQNELEREMQDIQNLLRK